MCKSTVKIVAGSDEDFEEVSSYLEKHPDVIAMRDLDPTGRSLVATILVPSVQDAKRFVETPGGPILSGVTQVFPAA